MRHLLKAVCAAFTLAKSFVFTATERECDWTVFTTSRPRVGPMRTKRATAEFAVGSGPKSFLPSLSCRALGMDLMRTVGEASASTVPSLTGASKR